MLCIALPLSLLITSRVGRQCLELRGIADKMFVVMLALVSIACDVVLCGWQSMALTSTSLSWFTFAAFLLYYSLLASILWCLYRRWRVPQAPITSRPRAEPIGAASAGCSAAAPAAAAERPEHAAAWDATALRI